MDVFHFFIGFQNMLKQEWNDYKYLIIMLSHYQHNKWFHIFWQDGIPCYKLRCNHCGFFKNVFPEYLKVYDIANSKECFPFGEL